MKAAAAHPNLVGCPMGWARAFYKSTWIGAVVRLAMPNLRAVIWQNGFSRIFVVQLPDC